MYIVQIGYATALDIYIIICFFFTVASLTEFAIINFIDIYYKRLKKWEEDFPKLGTLNKVLTSSVANSYFNLNYVRLSIILAFNSEIQLGKENLMK